MSEHCLEYYHVSCIDELLDFADPKTAERVYPSSRLHLPLRPGTSHLRVEIQDHGLEVAARFRPRRHRQYV